MNRLFDRKFLLIVYIAIFFNLPLYAESITFEPIGCEDTLACYRFDGDDDFTMQTKQPSGYDVIVTDGSSSGINGKIHGGVQKVLNSLIGSAAEFDGNKGKSGMRYRSSYIELDNPVAIRSHTGALSVSVWLYAQDVSKITPTFIFSLDNFRVGFSKDRNPLIWVPGALESGEWRVFSQKKAAV